MEQVMAAGMTGETERMRVTAAVAEREEQLLDALRGREPDACSQFVEAHYGGVHRFFWWLTRDREAAADLTQESFAAFWQSLDGLAREPDLKAWLYGIARNRWRKRCRDETSAPRQLAASLEEAVEVPDPAAGPEACVIVALDAAQLATAISELPPQYHEALLLRVFEELEYSQIAEALGIDVGLARWRVHRARCWLRQRLG
jgi:RNA polymerase sigma-70 factor, ECF subfamily